MIPKTRRGKTSESGWVRVGLIGFAGQMGHGSKQVTGQNGSFLNGSIGLQVESGLPVFFKQIFFFQLQKQINDNLFKENE